MVANSSLAQPLNTRRRIVSHLLIVSTVIGCKRWTERGAKGVGLLPPPPAAGLTYSSARTDNPHKQYAHGLWTRVLYRTATDRGYRVEVWDLIVGPRASTDSVQLPGAAVLQVRNGAGVLSVDARPQNIALGEVIAVSEGIAFRLENHSDLPLEIRVEVFTMHEVGR
jgi:mannose-6-phosphate isomerase-like protein (cupin superfamily)